MYRHFSFRHTEAQIVIRGDGIVPKCDLFGMYSVNMRGIRGPTHVREGGRERSIERREMNKGRRIASSFM